MLRNVLRKAFCHHRLRLVSLVFLTALTLACYLLVFLHLESIIQTNESEHHGIGRQVREFPAICDDILLGDDSWKEAATSVLFDLKNSGGRERMFNGGGFEVMGVKDAKRWGGDKRGGNTNPDGIEDLITNFNEILNKICLEYTKSVRAINKFPKLLTISDASPPRNDAGEGKYDISEAETVMLKKLLQGFGDVREKLFGEEDEKLKKLRSSNVWYLNLHRDVVGSTRPAWKVFQNRISQYSLYEDEEGDDERKSGGSENPGGSRLVDQLIRDLSSLKINSIDEVSSLGTQLKYIFNFEDGSRALFKPMRVPRDAEESLDTYYMYEKERHTSEIAAFHLDRILGFKRVPPAAGRVIDMISDLQVYLGQHSRKKFYLSPVGNQCFFGKCLYYCDPAHGVCGSGRKLEGSFVAFLPNKSVADWSSMRNPWIRSYSKHNRSFWERQETDGRQVCNSVRAQPPFSEWHSLLNVVDVHIFDFLIGNKDRHHFHYFSKFGNNSNFVLIDNGKGFGRPHHDILDILAPLYQCCMIRFTTLKRLFEFHSNPKMKLSRLMKESLSSDVLVDILTPAHLRALDRRVKVILQQVVKCISESGDPDKVVVDDDFLLHQESS